MPFLPLLAALAFALSPLVAGSFGGFAPDAFPVPQDDPPVQPAGYAFAIWGLIYLWLIVHGAYGAWRRRDHPGWRPTRAPLTASLALGAFWIPVANASPLWATLMIWAMALPALAALLRAGTADRWLLAVPLGLYAGWLTAAASVSIGLVLAGWGITGPIVAAWIALAVALAVAAFILWQRPAPGYAAAFAWALVGIAVQNGGAVPSLTAAALIAAACALAAGLRPARGG